MALAAARVVLGEAAEVRDIRFEQALLLDEQTTVGASALVVSPGVVDFTVETSQGDEQARQATAVLHAAEDEQPPAHDMSALLAAHPRREDGAEVRKRLGQRGVQYGPAFTGLGAVHTGEGETGNRAGRGRTPPRNPLPTRCLRRAPRTAGCLFPVRCGASGRPGPGRGRAGVALGYRVACAPTVLPASAHYCYARVTKADIAGVEADLDVLDEHGTVLLAVQGLRLGTGASEESHKDRVLGERLLTIEWRQRQLPELAHADAGTWLLISVTATDVVATALTDVPEKAMARNAPACAGHSTPTSPRTPKSFETTCVPVDSAVW